MDRRSRFAASSSQLQAPRAKSAQHDTDSGPRRSQGFVPPNPSLAGILGLRSCYWLFGKRKLERGVSGIASKAISHKLVGHLEF
jgi:hypothetical protein